MHFISERILALKKIQQLIHLMFCCCKLSCKSCMVSQLRDSQNELSYLLAMEYHNLKKNKTKVAAKNQRTGSYWAPHGSRSTSWEKRRPRTRESSSRSLWDIAASDNLKIFGFFVTVPFISIRTTKSLLILLKNIFRWQKQLIMVIYLLIKSTFLPFTMFVYHEKESLEIKVNK